MDAVTLGRRIAAIRQAKGLSQMDLVRHRGWSNSSITKIERGAVDSRVSTLARLAEDLGVELSAFFREDLPSEVPLVELAQVGFQGVVYFALDEAKDAVKIGFTQRSAEERVAEISLHHAGSLSLLQAFVGGKKLEEALHRKFAEAALGNEWFTAPPVVAWLKTARHGLTSSGPQDRN